MDEAERIFVVDDDGSVRKAVRRLLVSAGYDVEEFASAVDFLAAVPPTTPGVLVLDVRMPDLGGLELQRRLRRESSPLKVILVTAFPQPGESEQGLREGAIGFLVKPFESSALLDLVERARSA